MPLVIDYLLDCLSELGVTEVIGVPGDYAFALNDAILRHSKLRWVGACNELGAAYAADGYARMKGLAALCTTFGVGELSASCGIAGSYSEHVSVVHLVGMPALITQKSSSVIRHHTLGNNQYDLFYGMTDPVVCTKTMLTQESAFEEIDRVLRTCLSCKRPVYIGIPEDEALKDFSIPEGYDMLKHFRINIRETDPESLNSAVDLALEEISKSQNACLMPGVFVHRFGLRSACKELVELLNMPFTTMMMDKGSMDENDSHFIGMYDGRIMNEKVRKYVEETCDLIINLGALMTDFSSAAFTCNINPDKMLGIAEHSVSFGKKTFSNVNIQDFMTALLDRIKSSREKLPQLEVPLERDVHGLNQACKNHNFEDDRPLQQCCMYAAFEKFFQPGDVVITDTSSSVVGIAACKLPNDAIFINQTLWGAIGFSTPCTFGVQLAAPDRRVVLITGDGSLQVTAQEISQMGAQGQRPIIFVLNNEGYLIERILCDNPNASYNDIPNWNYSELPSTFGCKNWLGLKASTSKELAECMEKAENHYKDERSPGGVLIEVICGKLDAPDAAWSLYTQIKQKKHQMLDNSIHQQRH
jgi:indolepyruvate decarboxylase